MDNTHINTEKELLQRISQGDEKAFAEFFHLWYPKLSTQVLSVVKSLEITEEIVQDIFLKIWMTREALQDVTNARGYIWVMANNRCFNALKKIAVQRAREKEWLKTNDISQLQTETSENKFLSLLDQAIGQLPPQQKAVFLLSRRERKKQSEIASEMGLTVSTVKKYLERAIQAITAFMKKHYPLLLPVLPFLYWH